MPKRTTEESSKMDCALSDCWATEVLTLFSPPPSHDCRITLSVTWTVTLFIQEMSREALRILGSRWGWLEGKHGHRSGIWTGDVRVLLQARAAAALWVGTALLILWDVWDVPGVWFCWLNLKTSVICSFSGSGTSRCHLAGCCPLLLGSSDLEGSNQAESCLHFVTLFELHVKRGKSSLFG